MLQNQEEHLSSMEQIMNLIKARVPYIWVSTHEETRFIRNLYQEIILKLNKELWTWSSYQGLLRYNTTSKVERASGEMNKTWIPGIALEKISSYKDTNVHTSKNKNQGSVFVLKDFHTCLVQPIPRQMKDMYRAMIADRKTIIVVSSCLAHGPSGSKSGVEPTLDKQITVVEYELPSYETIEARVRISIEQMKKGQAGKISQVKLNYTEQEYNIFARTLQGLTELEIDNAISKSLTHLKRLDEKKILLEKKQIIQRSEILEYIGQCPDISDVGGLDAAKAYFDSYSNQFSTEAVEYGVEPLRGVLLIGVCGCLDGATPIHDPMDQTTKTVEQRYLEGKSFNVFAKNKEGKTIITKAEKPLRYSPAKMIEFTCENGQKITVTEGHRFLSPQGWMYACEVFEQLTLCENVPLLTSLDTYQTAIVKAKYVGTKEYFDFHVPVYENYSACGLWHHNTGKSLICKAVSSIWKLPLLRLDIGKVMGSLVGSSEEKMRAVISQAEAIAPCVTGDTLISLADGKQVPIRQLWMDSPKDLHVACLDEEHYKISTTPVKAITRRVHNTLTIKAAHGFEITSTPEHLHYVMRGDMPEWVRTDELKPGDCLSVPTKLPHSNISIHQWYPEDLKKSQNGGYYLGDRADRLARIDKLPVESTPSLGYLLGLIGSDGYIGKRHCIGFVNSSCKLLDSFENIMQEMFNIKPIRRLSNQDKSKIPDLPGLSDNPEFKDVYNSTITRKIVAIFLSNLLENIETLDYKSKIAFLAGWIDGDGCISHGEGDVKVSFCIKDPIKKWENARMMRSILCSIGIVPSKYNGESVIEITGSRAIQLCKLIKQYLTLSYKKNRAYTISYKDSTFDRDLGWNCKNLLDQERRRLNIKHKDIPLSTNTYWRHTEGYLISKRHMDIYQQTFKSEKLRQLTAHECQWIRIKSIEDAGRQEVFDLMCEDHHSFIGNLIITHNCTLWLDEIEKSLSGTKSSNHSDGGTLSRVFGTLLTAMEERMKDIVVLATANDIQALPPELIRRFNEIFFVDLPQPPERREIFEIHLRKRGRDPEKIKLNMKKLVAATHLFTGSEIEKVVKESIARAFRQKKKDITTKIILESINDTKPIATIMKEKIDDIRNWAKDRARYASSLAHAAAAPGAQKVVTSGGNELDFSDLDESDTIKQEKPKTTNKLDEEFAQFNSILED